ncbi:hypothetical protein HG535_0G04230 [Zygotorulaspora mrakii]|uniref:AB hydrolase-1 domain-containing protein n=1 Tax=Zygotorulaspora mrakii TaxID=42260 RepID=A0A7H9B7M5_ZYGMR|nr:uncharacterized protein HG535_0G04230 [Zygotorulaspora mrakii]QLG74540.1 hypothetical protein HG535_0G04230 [Zygotorulaspora mrakii]
MLSQVHERLFGTFVISLLLLEPLPWDRHFRRGGFDAQCIKEHRMSNSSIRGARVAKNHMYICRQTVYIRQAFRAFGTFGSRYSSQGKEFNRVFRLEREMTKEEKETEAGIMAWLSQWNRCKREEQLKDFEDRIMETVEVAGTKENSMKFNEINEWHFHNAAATDITTPTLLIHGYAASSMAYYRSFSKLTQKIRDLYAIDLPSFGVSAEVPLVLNPDKLLPLKLKHLDEDKFKIPYVIDSLKTKLAIQQVEDYYVDSIERWRKENKIDKFNLVGHSFGGYISFKYAIKYPDSVLNLCLLSPLGVESNVHSVNNDLQNDTVYNFHYEDFSSKFYNKRREIPSFIFNNQSDVLRWMGPVGARLCWGYVNSAYKAIPTMEYKQYVFELLYGKGGIPKTARTTFTKLFTRNLLARDPIMDSLRQLRAKKVLLVYGDHDWMNKYAGALMVKRLNEMRNNTSAEYIEVPDAGHNLFLQNPNYFSSSLTKFLAKE